MAPLEQGGSFGSFPIFPSPRGRRRGRLRLDLVRGRSRAGPAAGSPAGPVRDAVARAVRGDGPKPRLVVLLSIDQFRADYLTRYGDLFLPAGEKGKKPGGFQQLMKGGAYFANARYEHFPTFTGPGHAILLTGSHPYKTGIIANDWWDPVARREVYCVGDDRFQVVGAAADSRAKPMGPRNLRSSTVGDELKLATAGHAKVVTLALKDRAAILMGGHAQDLSIWFDDAGARWISSTAFRPDGKLPAWVEAVNGEHIPDRTLGTTWTAWRSAKVTDAVVAARTFAPKLAPGNGPYDLGRAFPHAVGAEKNANNYRAFTLTPAANAFVFETAKRAVAAEQMGRDDVPDLLAINLSTNDYVGHVFGPYSPEALDVTLATDRLLADFLGYLAGHVAGGLDRVVFVLSADHGVSPIPEDAAGEPFGLEAGRIDAEQVTTRIEAALAARYGAAPDGWFSRAADGKSSGEFIDNYVYLDPDALAAAIAGGQARSRREVEQTACDGLLAARIPGVYGCYGRSQILEGALADNDLAGHLAKAIYPTLSGDLLIVSEQMFLEGQPGPRYSTSHGTPYAYDTHVPVLFFAPGYARPGVYLDRAAPSDIAPTLSLLLGIELPSGCDGQPLLSALR